MKRRRFGIIWISVVLSMLLIISSAFVASAQSDTVDAETAKDTMPSPATGWLIFDGELIPGPYDILIEDDCILVNGRSYMASPELPKRTEEVPYDSNMVAAHNVITRALDTFYTFQTAVGLKVAQERTLASLQNEKLVDTAYFSGMGLSLVLNLAPGEEEPVPVLLMLADHPPEPPQPYAERRREILEDCAQALREWLSSGNLVILQGVEGLYVINSMKAPETLDNLRAIIASTPDMDMRIAAIRKIIHDDRMAKSIAERFE